jgi:hypothetical protein
VVLVASGETLAAIGAGVVGIALFAAFRTFSRLQLEVNDQELVASFGSFGQHIALSEIRGVGVERYDWLRHGGWGIRFGFNRRRACSVPFRRTGISIAIPGARWYVSSAHPDALAAAVEEALEDRLGAG